MAKGQGVAKGQQVVEPKDSKWLNFKGQQAAEGSLLLCKSTTARYIKLPYTVYIRLNAAVFINFKHYFGAAFV